MRKSIFELGSWFKFAWKNNSFSYHDSTVGRRSKRVITNCFSHSFHPYTIPSESLQIKFPKSERNNSAISKKDQCIKFNFFKTHYRWVNCRIKTSSFQHRKRQVHTSSVTASFHSLLFFVWAVFCKFITFSKLPPYSWNLFYIFNEKKNFQVKRRVNIHIITYLMV